MLYDTYWYEEMQEKTCMERGRTSQSLELE
jgi:hypothetical protein